MHYDRFTLTETPPVAVDGDARQDRGGEHLPVIIGYLQRVRTARPAAPCRCCWPATGRSIWTPCWATGATMGNGGIDDGEF